MTQTFHLFCIYLCMLTVCMWARSDVFHMQVARQPYKSRYFNCLQRFEGVSWLAGGWRQWGIARHQGTVPISERLEVRIRRGLQPRLIKGPCSISNRFDLKHVRALKGRYNLVLVRSTSIQLKAADTPALRIASRLGGCGVDQNVSVGRTRALYISYLLTGNVACVEAHQSCLGLRLLLRSLS